MIPSVWKRLPIPWLKWNATNAIATPWQHEEDREVVLRYFRFLRKHEDLYLDATRHAEIGLIFPRRAIHAGDASPLEYTEACGRTLIREHRLFDMIPDDLLTQTKLDGYRALVMAAPEYLQKDELAALREFSERGGKLLWTRISDEDRQRAGAMSPDAKRHQVDLASLPDKTLSLVNARTQRAQLGQTLLNLGGGKKRTSYATAPWSVEMHVYRQDAKKRWIVHLVNYNHVEGAQGKSVSAREAPTAAEPVKVQLRTPAGQKIRQVRFLSPDEAGTKQLEFRHEAGTLQFTTPSFLVYGVCVLEE